jgi:4-hydroxy-2-oxoheptanedioate aldolase
MRDTLSEKLGGGGTALGVWASDPDMVELLAHLGFDWFMIDQMFTSNDWQKTEMLIRTGEAAGITPVVRVQSNPWIGPDPRIAVDVSRLQGIGARHILVSHADISEIRTCAEVSHDWHRKALHIHPFDAFNEWNPNIEAMSQETFIIPHAESVQALNQLEETLAIPEVKQFFFAMTDASRVLMNSEEPDWYNEKLWELVDRAVARGRDEGVVIGANTSYAYDMEEMGKRVIRLHERGVRMVLIQGAPFLFQIAIGKFLRDLNTEIGA